MSRAGGWLATFGAAALLACSGTRKADEPCRPALAAQWSSVGSTGVAGVVGLVGPELDGQPALVAWDGFTTAAVFRLGDAGVSWNRVWISGAAPRAVADLDGDGAADVVALDRASPRVVILKGDGTGRFAAPVFHDVPGPPSAVAIADLDRDGRRDLAVASDDATMSVLLGAPGGGLLPPVTYATKPGAGASVVASDLDGDGTLDLAVAYAFHPNPCPRPPCHCLPYFTSGLAVLAGRGDGTFGAARLVPTPPGPFGLVATDLGGGAGRDLAMSFHRPSCSDAERTAAAVWREGLEGPAPILSSGKYVSRPAVLDLDRDGRLDLALQASCTFVGLLADGAGGFTAADTGVPASPSCTGDAVVAGDLLAGDLDGDGHADLASAHDGSLRTFLATCGP